MHVFLRVTIIAVKSYLHSATQKNEQAIHQRIIFIFMKLLCSFLVTKMIFIPFRIISFRFLRLHDPLHNFGLLWNWLKLKLSVLRDWNDLTDTPVHIWWTRTTTGEWSWTPIGLWAKHRFCPCQPSEVNPSFFALSLKNVCNVGSLGICRVGFSKLNFLLSWNCKATLKSRRKDHYFQVQSGRGICWCHL